MIISKSKWKELGKPAYDTYIVPVDSTLNLAQRIKAVRSCQNVNPDIVEENFPMCRIGTSGKTRIILIPLSAVARFSDVPQHMDELDLWPVWIEELLALGEGYPIIHRQSILMSLGSVWERPNGNRFFPYLEFYGAMCNLYLHKDGERITAPAKNCFFPAVSKESDNC